MPTMKIVGVFFLGLSECLFLLFEPGRRLPQTPQSRRLRFESCRVLAGVSVRCHVLAAARPLSPPRRRAEDLYPRAATAPPRNRTSS